jgi:hypothetical protein
MTISFEYSKNMIYFYTTSIKLYNNNSPTLKKFLYKLTSYNLASSLRSNKVIDHYHYTFTCFISLVGNGEHCHFPLFLHTRCHVSKQRITENAQDSTHYWIFLCVSFNCHFTSKGTCRKQCKDLSNSCRSILLPCPSDTAVLYGQLSFLTRLCKKTPLLL